MMAGPPLATVLSTTAHYCPRPSTTAWLATTGATRKLMASRGWSASCSAVSRRHLALALARTLALALALTLTLTLHPHPDPNPDPNLYPSPSPKPKPNPQS